MGRGLSGLPPKHGPPETSRQAASPCPGSPSPCALPLLPAPGHQSPQERWGQPRPGQVFWEVWPLKFLVLNQSKSNAASSSLLQLQVGFFYFFCKKEIQSLTCLILQHHFPRPKPRTAGLRGSSSWVPPQVAGGGHKHCSVPSQLPGPKGQHGHKGHEDQLAIKMGFHLGPTPSLPAPRCHSPISHPQKQWLPARPSEWRQA